MGTISTEDKTRPYSVYIVDQDNVTEGSGVLFYPGGDRLFVFTCAHVVDRAETVCLEILKPISVKRDLYQMIRIRIPKEQILYSPLDHVTEQNGELVHSEDFAIIEVRKPQELDLETTDYFFGETLRNNPIYTQGYPNGMPENAKPLDYLECFHGVVVVNAADEGYFTVRITDGYVDQGNRVFELQGISGAPIWDGEQEQGLLGLMSSAYGSSAVLAKVFATKMWQIRTLMREKYGITIERRLLEIPEEEVAGNEIKSLTFDGTIGNCESDSANDEWIQEQTDACKCWIDGLQLQKAIDTAKNAIADPRFSSCSRKAQKRLMQYLLYCYEIGDLDAEFELLEEEMRDHGLINKWDPLRRLTRSFMKRDYEETIRTAEYCIQNEKENKMLFSCANAFLILAKAYEEKLPVEESIGRLLDAQEQYVYQSADEGDVALIYQMIGYVYGERYHDHINSVRFLNRAYRIGSDNVILENLGAAYYLLAISDATGEDDKVDLKNVDRRALYKARECFLMVRQKADDLFWAGTMRRVGVFIFNAFVFLNDNYRILTVYPDVKKYVEPCADEDAFWRDIEMKHAKVMAQSGAVNLSDYPHIKTSDRTLLETVAVLSRWQEAIHQITSRNRWRRIYDHEMEKALKATLAETERKIQRIDRRDKLAIYVQLMNLYGDGVRLFGWSQLERMKTWLERIQGYQDVQLSETMENYLYEFEAPIGDVIRRYQDTFERNPNIITWQELNHLYIRHGMMDQADAMYRELFAERRELIEEEPEYAYRAYIDYVTMYRRDLKDALQCYLDAKEAFQDTDIEGFWELELMLYSNTFNDPDRFETDRRSFLERGLVTEEQYHRMAFCAYLANLNREKAEEHFEAIRKYPHQVDPRTGLVIADVPEIQYLNWIGALEPHCTIKGEEMTKSRANGVIRNFSSESWHREMDGSARNHFRIEKKISIDAWGLYILAETDKMELLKKLDVVFVPHLVVIQLLDNLSKTGNEKIRDILNFLVSEANVRLQSAGFKEQVNVRNIAPYYETAATVAIGREQDALIALGNPKIEPHLIEKFAHGMIRVTDLENMIKNSLLQT